MLLKRLEISGFKSFARPVTLEFPTKITSIVGPNGSGKSNIADSIRWVLGEQSMKHLRGKKGEDLIFGGSGSGSPSSPHIARLAKASVALVFDNKKKIFPVEFDEVILSRRVYRDGANDYLINGSQVRLKDIIELLSKVGLGASQHHIIAQGDADRILYASPKERKSMAEESLGLKIFELKKHEAERKLSATDENIRQVESLRREIQPHLKFLESQAEKMKNVSAIRQNLEVSTKEYVGRELKTLDLEIAEIRKNKLPVEARVKELERDIKESEKILGKESEARIFLGELKKYDEALDALSKKRRELEREAGRLEAAEVKPKIREEAGGLAKERVKSILLDLARDLESVSRSGTMEEVRNTIFSTTQKIYRILESLNGEEKKEERADNAAGLKQAKSAIEKLETEAADLLAKKRAHQQTYEANAVKMQKEGAAYRQKSEELNKAKDELNKLLTKEDRWEEMKTEFGRDFGQWMRGTEPFGNVLSDNERADMRKKIERLRIRLEEAGGVDEGIIDEFEETKKRDDFLAKELEDLKNTSASLKGIFDELEERIENDFEDGLEKINKLFGEFFHEIFGGGKAEIKMKKPETRRQLRGQAGEEDLETGWQEEMEEEEPGLEIIVDIPRKRIRSLSMLSGGERALTSIALLFAMSTVNPPPFLVLDETDAALDEANSQRYANMLKELGKKVQLIVVTHNRETMKSADVLYGVTMGGDGVSKLLSLKFEEAEDVLAKGK